MEPTMPQFFTTKTQWSDDRVLLTGDDVNHIKHVLRMKPGEEITLRITGDETEYRCGIISIDDTQIECQLRFTKEDQVELPSKVTLFQALPKGDKMEWIIQKSVELGASQIIPVACERCVVRLEPKRAAAKTSRWQIIAQGAAEQSRRAIVPRVGEVLPFKEAIRIASAMDKAWIPYELADDMEHTKAQIAAIKPNQEIGFFIGPEGGFTKEEIALAKEHGIIPITLGKRILRTETAGLTLMSWIMYQLQ
jgi:16S rRNA (uracil1498-N3)-methyltransferase